MLIDIRADFFCCVQVDLGHNMRVTALSTIGVRVKNESTGNYSFMYVSQYFLAYKRDGDKKWRRYHRNDVSLTVRIDWDYLSYSISFCSSYQSVVKNRKCVKEIITKVMIFVFLIIRLLDITLFFSLLFHFVNTIRRTLLVVGVHIIYFLIFW